MPRIPLNYPHPVLSDETNDFPDSGFSIELVSHDDSGDSLTLGIECSLECPGIENLLASGDATALVRVMCNKTSYRYVEKLDTLEINDLRIPKARVSGAIEIQAFIVSLKPIQGYRLPEFNQDYFGSMSFRVAKGDILAVDSGFTIKLESILENEMAGIVQVRPDSNATEMHVYYSAEEDIDPKNSEYIYVDLPKRQYTHYGQLRTKRYLNQGAERFLVCTVVLPVLTEAITRLRDEEMLDDEYVDRHYKETIWGRSLWAALNKAGVSELDYDTDCISLANRVLGDVLGDSLGNLHQKVTEWSTINDEDDVL